MICFSNLASSTLFTWLFARLFHRLDSTAVQNPLSNCHLCVWQPNFIGNRKLTACLANWATGALSWIIDVHKVWNSALICFSNLVSSTLFTWLFAHLFHRLDSTAVQNPLSNCHLCVWQPNFIGNRKLTACLANWATGAFVIIIAQTIFFVNF